MKVRFWGYGSVVECWLSMGKTLDSGRGRTKLSAWSNTVTLGGVLETDRAFILPSAILILREGFTTLLSSTVTFIVIIITAVHTLKGPKKKDLVRAAEKRIRNRPTRERPACKSGRGKAPKKEKATVSNPKISA